MKILITGCAGFIGANFTEYILQNYPIDTVVGVDCLTYAANIDALEGLKKYSNFTFYKADICDSGSMDSIFSSELPEVVINFAAESHVDNSITDAKSFILTNVFGTQVLLDVSVRYGVKRFHQISTDEVYGDVPIDAVKSFSEDSPLNPSSPYSASKAAADLLALSYMRTHSLPVSISRSSNNYGKYQHREKLIPKTIERIVLDEPVPLYGDGRNIRDWLYVIDHCRAVDLIIRVGKCGIYNVGADNEWSNIDLVRKIAEILDKPDAKIKFIEDRKGHDRRYAVSSDKIKKLGWTVKTNFLDTLTKTVCWYAEKSK